MNDLSWFLLLANIIPNIRELSVGFFVVACFAGALQVVFTLAIIDDDPHKYKDFLLGGRRLYPIYGIIVFFFVITAFLPSQRTMHLIAASELGEMAIESPVASEIYGKLNSILDSFILPERNLSNDNGSS